MAARSAVSIQGIEEALFAIDPVFTGSAQFECEPLSELTGSRIVLKVETVNPIRSFKGRGACWFVHLHRDSAPRPWTCASAGNFGQGLAYAARRYEIPLVIFAAESANALKVERMRQLGADVRLIGSDFDGAKHACRRFAESSGATFVEDGRDPAITEGAGTIGIEILDEPEPLDALLLPVGNGALVNGVGTWIREHRPETKIVGVGAARAPAMERSFRQGRVVSFEEPVETVADGAAARVPVPEAVEMMRHVVDDMILVEEEPIHRAMQSLRKRAGLIAEGAGALPLAAATVHRERFRGQRLGLVVTGSNVSGG